MSTQNAAPKKAEKHTITIHPELSTYQHLERAAKKDRRTLSQFVTILVEKAVDAEIQASIPPFDYPEAK